MSDDFVDHLCETLYPNFDDIDHPMKEFLDKKDVENGSIHYAAYGWTWKTALMEILLPAYVDDLYEDYAETQSGSMRFGTTGNNMLDDEEERTSAYS